MNYGKGYRDCIKRNGDKTRMQSTCYIVTSCHGNNYEMWNTSCLIMQHKPYIVELRLSETQKSNDSTNETQCVMVCVLHLGLVIPFYPYIPFHNLHVPSLFLPGFSRDPGINYKMYSTLS